MQTKFNRLSLAAVLIAAPLAGNATSSYCGPNVCYVWDETQAAIGLFGDPIASGDSMKFVPSPNFKTESNNTTGLPLSTSIAADFVFDHVYATTPGVEIGSVKVLEAGDYNISGDSSGNPDTVGVDLYTKVTDTISSENTTDHAQFGSANDSGGTWIVLSGAIDPSSAFTASAHDVAISVNDILSAYTDEIGGDAWVWKKFTVTVGTVTPVPVPAAAWLFTSGLGLLGAVRRRVTRIG